eukprot:m.282477 g.282477  ORF g.282477 m.282477 type:complete len:153 (-) comp11111_c0_seq19:488-946(-)
MAGVLQLPSIEEKRRNGQCYTASATRFSNGNVLVVNNPSGSGRSLYVYRFAHHSGNGHGILLAQHSDTTHTTGTAQSVTCLQLDGAAGVATAYQNYTGGTLTTFYTMYTTNGGGTVDLPECLVVPPGRALVFDNASIAGSFTQGVSVWWYEE